MHASAGGGLYPKMASMTQTTQAIMYMLITPMRYRRMPAMVRATRAPTKRTGMERMIELFTLCTLPAPQGAGRSRPVG